MLIRSFRDVVVFLALLVLMGLIVAATVMFETARLAASVLLGLAFCAYIVFAVWRFIYELSHR